MGKLNDMCRALEAGFASQGLTPIETLKAKGAVSLKCGFMVGLVGAGDVDDPAKIDALRAAALSEAGISL